MTLAQSALAQTYTAIDCPESFETLARGINDRGDIVGVCEDANGRHGFLLRKGVFTLIDECGDCFVNAFLLTRRGFTNLAFPHALETVASGINTAGQIVGHYFGEDEAFHGFLRERKDQ
jgi:probable HAF family extracellular repeat protein